MTTPFVRTYGPTYHRRLRAFLATGALLAGVAAALAMRPFRFEIEGESMEPELRHGDRGLAIRLRARAGDVVVVRHPDLPGFPMAKRLEAEPGELAPSGAVMTQAEWFVLGDNPTGSTDSRHFGPVSREAILGRAVLVYRPLGRARFVRRMEP